MTRPVRLVGAFLATTASLQAQHAPAGLSQTIAGTYRVEIHSPAPRGTWAGLVIVEATATGYNGTFKDPDSPATYPVASVTAANDSLRIVMAGEATGSVFFLAVRGDSLIGFMTSTTHGDTPVFGRRLRP